MKYPQYPSSPRTRNINYQQTVIFSAFFGADLRTRALPWRKNDPSLTIPVFLRFLRRVFSSFIFLQISDITHAQELSISYLSYINVLSLICLKKSAHCQLGLNQVIKKLSIEYLVILYMSKDFKITFTPFMLNAGEGLRNMLTFLVVSLLYHVWFMVPLWQAQAQGRYICMASQTRS